MHQPLPHSESASNSHTFIDATGAPPLNAHRDRRHPYARPVARLDPSKDLTFQLLDCAQTKRAPIPGVSSFTSYEEVPEIRLYGVTREGNSVLVRVFDFEPFLWIEAPPQWSSRLEQTLADFLNEQLQLSGGGRLPARTIVRIETHTRRSLQYHRAGPNDRVFLKLFVQLPQHVPRVRSLVQGGREGYGLHCPKLWQGGRTFQTFESNVIFPLRFLVDLDVGGSNWITVRGGSYQLAHTQPHQWEQMRRGEAGMGSVSTAAPSSVFQAPPPPPKPTRTKWGAAAAAAAPPAPTPSTQPHVVTAAPAAVAASAPTDADAAQAHHHLARVSLAQIEAVCCADAITAHDAKGEYMDIAPLRILSFDIECLGRKGHFPEAEHDPVIQIANQMTLYGTSYTSEAPFLKTIFCVGTVAAIAGADVRCFDREEDMLCAWAKFLVQCDPDVLTGYNICNFDMPYLLKRAKALKIESGFCFWSRLIGDRTEARQRQFMSKQMGNREYYDVNIEGRVTLDVMVVMQRDYKLRSYSLNNVSQVFLGEQKEDVHHSIIGDLQKGTDETRRRLAVYCLKDSLLPLRLLEKLLIVVNNVEMARVTGVPVGWLLERGQGIKVFSQILRKAKARGLLFPAHEYSGGNADAKYEGATVLDPVKGFYNRPIATLDFASLYPSIMMAHNLCYSTLVPPQDIPLLSPEDYVVTPSGNHFVKKDVYSGILPEILDDLLAARKTARKEMALAADPLQKAVLNGRQLALKISANSVYGFTGAQVGKLPCLEISRSVTAYGRSMIERTKQVVEATYAGATVVYGDTDSVFIQCAMPGDPAWLEHGAAAATGDAAAGEGLAPDATLDSLEDRQKVEIAMRFGHIAAAEVTKSFEKPIKLEFEKVYFPFLLMNKKRYAGLLFTKPEKEDKMDAKGIETVRRDNCPLVANMLEGVLKRVLVQRSVPAAVDYVKGTISDLLMNRVDISQLVVSKAFTKAESEYASKQAHIELIERMRKRDPASAPSIGDRVAYVIIKGQKGAKAYERSEDPVYVLENNIPIDVQYYLDHHLAGPITRVFEGVLPDPTKLLTGDHTRQIAVQKPSAAASGMMKFVTVKRTCLACKGPVKGDAATCDGCAGRAADVYLATCVQRSHFESLYARVWAQCQQCQGSLHQDVLCTSRDCPVFYMRKKVEKDLGELQDAVDRFGIAVPDW